MVYTWDTLQQYHFNPPTGKLRRNPYVKKHYNKYQQELQNNGFDIGTIIKHKFFSNHTENHICSPFYVITPNDFPYDVSKGIHHYLLWFNPDNKYPMYNDYDHVAKILDRHVGSGKYVCFMNPLSIQSVPAVKHYHVFFR